MAPQEDICSRKVQKQVGVHLQYGADEANCTSWKVRRQNSSNSSDTSNTRTSTSTRRRSTTECRRSPIRGREMPKKTAIEETPGSEGTSSTYATCYSSIPMPVYWTDWYSFRPLRLATAPFQCLYIEQTGTLFDLCNLLQLHNDVIIQACNPRGKELWYSTQQARRRAISRQAGKVPTRFCPGTVALNKIRHYQKRTDTWSQSCCLPDSSGKSQTISRRTCASKAMLWLHCMKLPRCIWWACLRTQTLFASTAKGSLSPQKIFNWCIASGVRRRDAAEFGVNKDTFYFCGTKLVYFKSCSSSNMESKYSTCTCIRKIRRSLNSTRAVLSHFGLLRCALKKGFIHTLQVQEAIMRIINAMNSFLKSHTSHFYKCWQVTRQLSEGSNSSIVMSHKGRKICCTCRIKAFKEGCKCQKIREQ